MANAITPQAVIEVIESVKNYLDIDLSGEALSPSAEMGRQEKVEQLEELVQTLSQMKTFTTSTSTTTTGNVKALAKNVLPVLAKQSPVVPMQTSLSTVAPEMPLIDSIRSKLKVLMKWTIGELKQHADYSGFLKKHKKQWNSKWNQRFCVLRDGILLYFESDKEMGKGKGYIILGSYKFTIPPNSNGFVFELESSDKSTAYTFQADHKKEIDIWKHHLMKVTDKGYTSDQLNAINVIAKEIGFSITESAADVDEVDDVKDNIEEEEVYDDVVVQPGPSLAAQHPHGHTPATTPAQFPLPPVQVVPVQLPAADVAESGDEIYEDIPANTGNTTNINNNNNNNNNTTITTTTINNSVPYKPVVVSNNNIPYIPPHVPLQTAGDEFSTSNLYIGRHDCISGLGVQDLSFRRGDVMYILEKVDVNWWIAYHLNGKVGLVAKNFLKAAFAT